MSTPVRLGKVEEKTFIDELMDKVEAWVNHHAFFCLFVLFAVLISLFVTLIFVLTGVSATDSGMTYNHFMDVI